MNKKVYDYFTDFSKLKLERDNNIILLDQEEIDWSFDSNINHRDLCCEGALKYTTRKNEFFVKEGYTQDSIYGLASSKMYGELGILTPQTFPVKYSDEKKGYYAIASENVYSIPDIVIGQPRDVLKQVISAKKYLKKSDNTIWSSLYDNGEKDLFLETMTNECFEDFTGMFLLDSLRTDSDRHMDNYFFYKAPKAEKWEGVIPIDLEYSETLDRYCLPTKIYFKDFLKSEYSIHTPNGNRDSDKTHKNRLKDILIAVQDGKFSSNQIKLLKDAVAYDLPLSIKDICKHYGITYGAEEAYGMTSCLWEYNQKHLGKELEM